MEHFSKNNIISGLGFIHKARNFSIYIYTIFVAYFSSFWGHFWWFCMCEGL